MDKGRFPLRRRTALVCLVLLFAAGLWVGRSMAGQAPLAGLRADEIQWVKVELSPPGTTHYLTQEEIAQLAPLLNRVVTHRRDDSWRDYNGQAVVFTIRKTDDSLLTVMPYNPFIVIDGVGYRTEYTPCEALSHFANTLRTN